MCLEEVNEQFVRLFRNIWIEERVTDEWLKGIIDKLTRKSDLTVCECVITGEGHSVEFRL